MKSLSLFLKTSAAAAAFALCLAPALRAATSDSDLPEHGATPARHADDQNASARAIVGQDVQSKNNEDLGEVKNLVVDTNSGKVLFALITQGGVLGLGEKIHAVPYNLLTVPQQGRDTIIVNTDKVTLDSSPVVREDDLAALADSGSEIYRHYGQDWHALMSAATPDDSEIRRLMTVDQLTGKDVMNNGRKVGTIDDLVISPHKNQSAALLDPEDDYAGPNQKFLVSFNQLQHTPDGTLTTSLKKSDFAGAKPARGNDWWAAKVGYPYAWAAGYEGVGYSLNRPAVTNASKRPTIADIRQAIRNDPELRPAADRISFDQQNDTLVLHGSVASRDLKEKIADKLNRVATGWNIDNQITVRNAAE